MIEIHDENGLVWAISGSDSGHYFGYYEGFGQTYSSAEEVYEAVRDSTASGIVPQEVTEWLGL